MYIIVFALVKALQRVQKLRCNKDKILISRDQHTVICLLNAYHGNILCDGNRSKYLKTSQFVNLDSCKVKTYNSCSKSVRESFACNT